MQFCEGREYTSLEHPSPVLHLKIYPEWWINYMSHKQRAWTTKVGLHFPAFSQGLAGSAGL